MGYHHQHTKCTKTGLLTRLPSNLRPTTREFAHLVTRGHSGHVAEMAITPFDLPYAKTHAARNLHGSMCYRSGVIADRSFTLRE